MSARVGSDICIIIFINIILGVNWPKDLFIADVFEILEKMNVKKYQNQGH